MNGFWTCFYTICILIYAIAGIIIWSKAIQREKECIERESKLLYFSRKKVSIYVLCISLCILNLLIPVGIVEGLNIDLPGFSFGIAIPFFIFTNVFLIFLFRIFSLFAITSEHFIRWRHSGFSKPEKFCLSELTHKDSIDKQNNKHYITLYQENKPITCINIMLYKNKEKLLEFIHKYTKEKTNACDSQQSL